MQVERTDEHPPAESAAPICNEQRCQISVLIASLGRPSLITALQSIFGRSSVRFEVVLVLDDPDVSAERLLAEIPPARRRAIRVIQNPENLGLTRSLNRGLAQCRGEFIARLDDDDRFSPERLDQVVERFQAHPEVGVIVSDTRVIDGERHYQLTVPAEHDAIAEALQHRNILVHSAFNIRRTVLQRVGGYNEAYRYAQDYELYLRLLRHGVRFMGVNQPLAERNEEEGTITVSRRQHQALFSLSALCLHHASTWRGDGDQVRAICTAFARFVAPKSLRKGVRWLRAVSRGEG
ncbi:glycosyl transferase family 2 [Ferrimonas balearica DSM 9799]|uniref:Glycosyl transferase family 2 n=1 Tax=Ferrimonas balearica (strain DSM 9799 / CCM 4581 / KCTC 23876 / PAT) TaxID=550540 RepID=E1SLS2_FERBD|nr:glycosyltransferase [Ferrimonas balearica]ADN74471.1 glycosyl transferase family 2 [Ferrimonas balearica DSM 9799]